jgi:hypothetical protein
MNRNNLPIAAPRSPLCVNSAINARRQLWANAAGSTSANDNTPLYDEGEGYRRNELRRALYRGARK